EARRRAATPRVVEPTACDEAVRILGRALLLANAAHAIRIGPGGVVATAVFDQRVGPRDRNRGRCVSERVFKTARRQRAARAKHANDAPQAVELAPRFETVGIAQANYYAVPKVVLRRERQPVVVANSDALSIGEEIALLIIA